MHNLKLHTLGLFCASVVLSGPVLAVPVMFTDSIFNLANYTQTTSILSADTSISVTSPSQALNIVITETAGGGAFGTLDALVVELNNGWTYNPSTQGAIATIDAQVDKTFSTNVAVNFNNRFRPTILQGGVYYTAVVNGPILNGPGSVAGTLSVTGLTANDFLSFDPTTQVIGAAHPNFSAGILQFGLSQFLGATAVANTTATIVYDNLALTLNVPEPASFAILLTGLAGLIGARRARSA